MNPSRKFRTWKLCPACFAANDGLHDEDCAVGILEDEVDRLNAGKPATVRTNPEMIDEQGNFWTLTGLLADLDRGDHLYLTPKMCADLAAILRAGQYVPEGRTWVEVKSGEAKGKHVKMPTDYIWTFGPDYRTYILSIPAISPGERKA